MANKTYRVRTKGKVFKTVSKQKKEKAQHEQEARKLRGSSRWKKLSRYFKREHPICQLCWEEPSDEVHHIKPVSKRPDLAFCHENLVALCEECHDIIHARMVRGEDVEEEIHKAKKRNQM